MIQRFCFIKLRDEHVADRSALARTLRAQLVAAGADATIGVPADASASRWDLSIVVHAASLEAWNALSGRPAMIRIFDDLAARAAVVKAWTFSALPAPLD